MPSCSYDERRLDTFSPDPDPPLKMNISSRYQSAIESIRSSTWRMKHADACCARLGTPMLNHTGELNDAFCVTRMCLSSASKLSLSASVAKRP
jgi:hypothetical protein